MNPSLRRTIDWKFLLSLVVLISLLYLVFTGLQAYAASEEKTRQINSLTEQNDMLLSELDQRDRQAARERRQAAAERRAIVNYTRSLAERQREILAYLVQHGIEIPTRLIEPIEAPQDFTEPSSTTQQPRHRDRPSGSNVGGGGFHGGNTPPPSGGPTGPGNSGNAPGHNHHGPKGPKGPKDPKGPKRLLDLRVEILGIEARVYL